ncbi:MAG TPA: hypothetical protein VKO83_13360 [Steroidobacteraceae bacterium]|nr:hypothetical protein [Steroidobacteraceae bacterium]
MKMIRRSLLWMMALALPASLLLLLPLRAQETAAPVAAPPAAAAPVPEPEARDELPADERVSADNNLSFPVDI